MTIKKFIILLENSLFIDLIEIACKVTNYTFELFQKNQK